MFDDHFLACVSGSEFHLATTLCISFGTTIAPAEINGHKFTFIALVIGYLDGLADIFIGNPDMPGPEDGITRILDGDDGIALPDSRSMHLEGYVILGINELLHFGIIVLYIGNQIRRVLP